MPDTISNNADRHGAPRDEQVIERAIFDGCEVRAIDDEKRTATFVAATEGGVRVWQGKEYLRMSGARLKRFRANPVILDTHNRFEAGAVIGNATVTVENRELIAVVKFATTERANDIWLLVKGGFLKALSVGFLPITEKTVELAAGETDGKDENEIVGPALIFKSWELYEISVVPVPADPAALRRGFNQGSQEELALMTRALLQITNRILSPREEDPMPKEEKKAPEGKADAQPPDGEELQAATATLRSVVDTPPTPEEINERDLIARKNQIMELAPDNLRGFAQALVLENVPVEDARKRMLEELEKQSKSAGTPEGKEAEGQKKQTAADVDSGLLSRSLLG